MNYIYCYINKINGHRYVGQTNNLKRRQNEHWRKANNENSIESKFLFHRKLKEYGKDNFSFVILEEVENKNLVNEREIFWIDKLKTYVGDHQGGYNLTRGGNAFPIESKFSKEDIKQIKILLKEGTSYSEISKKFNMSLSYISGINNGNYFSEKEENYPLYKYYQSQEEINYVYSLLIDTSIPMTEIAKIVNKSYSTIKKSNSGALQHDNNLSYPLRKINSVKQKAQDIQQALISGMTDTDIIDKFKVSKSTIRRINKGETHYDDSLHYPLREACIDYSRSN